MNVDRTVSLPILIKSASRIGSLDGNAVVVRHLVAPPIFFWMNLKGHIEAGQSIERFFIRLSGGVDFLDFLRSGEKDIHVFADSRREQKRRRCSDCCAAVKSTEIKASRLGPPRA